MAIDVAASRPVWPGFPAAAVPEGASLNNVLAGGECYNSGLFPSPNASPGLLLRVGLEAGLNAGLDAGRWIGKLASFLVDCRLTVGRLPPTSNIFQPVAVAAMVT